MRTVDAHLLGDKMDEAVTHYINSHQSDEAVHVDANALALNVQEDGTRVNVLHTQNFTTQLCRQVPISEHETEGQWTEELLDAEGRLAALMAQITAQSRAPQPSHHKESVRSDVDTVILDSSMRLFNGPPLDQSTEPIVVQVPHLPPLPPLQQMKRCPEADWFHDKTKNTLKSNASIVSEEESVLEITHSKQQSKKSLPHKKRISRKLKKGNGYGSGQQDIVVLSCAEGGHSEEILPDSFVPGLAHPHPPHLPDDGHHIAHEVRPMLICQLCGEYYGEEQLKFYHHLKQHYEPHATIIIENPELPIDKMSTSCIVDNGVALPDSIVELSLENTVPKTIYQSMDKHILYTTTDKTLSYTSNKVLYSVANMDKEPEQAVVTTEAEKTDLYETLDKLELYNCGKCNKTFRKQKQCEAHIKESHLHAKLEEIGEFSEPEDLMEGIHVSVEEPGEPFEAPAPAPLLPHLTVDSGHVTQDHARHWYIRNGAGAGGVAGAGGAGAGSEGGAGGACGSGALCPVCPAPAHDSQHLKVIKEEILRRILESDVTTDAATFSENIISDAPDLPQEAPPPDDKPNPPQTEAKKKPTKKFECPQCDKWFKHRNSLLYHMLSHSGKQHVCRECGKGFYTASSLKIHKRVHNGDKPYKCEACGRDFRQWSDLTYHKISKHSDVKMFKCDYCGKEFARKYSLNVHRRIHTGERNYKCEYCAKCFSASSYRLSHMRTHTGDKPYKCSQCEKCFRVAGDLRRHTLIHDKVRNRLEAEKKAKAKQDIEHDDSSAIKTENQPEAKNEPQKIKKIAVASTTKSPQFKAPDKKNTTKKKNVDAKGAPNVTLDQLDSNYTNVEVFDTRQGFEYGKDLAFDKDMHQDRDMLLRPMYRVSGVTDGDEKGAPRADNTDGKMFIYTHIEKGKEFACMVSTPGGAVSEMRQLERDAPEATESGFIERLTALYNIPAV